VSGSHSCPVWCASYVGEHGYLVSSNTARESDAMSSNKNFFLSPQAAAIYKHKLIKSYIPA
jgi:hypothetical protein